MYQSPGPHPSSVAGDNVVEVTYDRAANSVEVRLNGGEVVTGASLHDFGFIPAITLSQEGAPVDALR